MTLKAIHDAVNGSNFGKTGIGSYKGFINENEITKFLASLKIFLYYVVLRLRGKNVAPPIMTQTKIAFCKIQYFDISNKEMVQLSKSKPKKFSTLCTFKIVHNCNNFFLLSSLVPFTSFIAELLSSYVAEIGDLVILYRFFLGESRRSHQFS